MKAVVYTTYGTPDVLQISEVPTPTPKDNEVLIRIHAAAVTTTDCNLRGGDKLMRLVFGLRRPKRQVLGTEFAGEIEAVGKDVTRFEKVTRSLPRPAPGLVRMPSTSVCRKTGRWHRNRPMRPMRKPPPSAKGD